MQKGYCFLSKLIRSNAFFDEVVSRIIQIPLIYYQLKQKVVALFASFKNQQIILV